MRAQLLFRGQGGGGVAISYNIPTGSVPGTDQGPTVATCGEACKKWE